MFGHCFRTLAGILVSDIFICFVYLFVHLSAFSKHLTVVSGDGDCREDEADTGVCPVQYFVASSFWNLRTIVEKYSGISGQM